jgi:amino-acid N-acetyltransferase
MTSDAQAAELPVVVRAATPADLPAIRALLTSSGLPSDGLESAEVLVAMAEVRLVGAVALERHGTSQDEAFLLRSAAVATTWRGRGVGAALTAAALERVDEAGAPVGLLTETAATYFPRFGFVPVERVRLPAALAASTQLQGGCPVSAQALLRTAKQPRSASL